MVQSNSAEQLPWEQDNWLGDVRQWTESELIRHGLTITGPLDAFHVRAWSIVVRVPTNAGQFYFKALCPVLRYEPGITKALSEWQPKIIMPVMAIDAERGWMLMPDGGVLLRRVIETDHNLNHWKSVLHKYSELQIAMIPHVRELMNMGVHDRRLEELPSLYTSLINDRQILLIDQPDGLTLEEFEKLQKNTSTFGAKCKELAGYGIPETLQHDDFHDANIFFDQDNLKFFDWAESFIAHPFFTMVVTTRVIAYQFGLDENSKEIKGLQDLYLEHWQEYGNRRELSEAFRLAMVIGKVNRALTWHMVMSRIPEQLRGEDSGAVPGWLQLFLERIPEGD
jgi:hypothetical protein